MKSLLLLGGGALFAVEVRLAAAGWELVAHSVLLELAVAGAGLAGAGIVWKKAVRPAWMVMHKLNVLADAVAALPAFRLEVLNRLDDGSERFRVIEGQLALLVNADRQEVAAAIEHSHQTDRTGWRE